MNPNWFLKFEEYLNEEMSREEKSLFEASLAADKEMANAFRVYRTIETEMRNHNKYSVQESALKHSLQTLNGRYFKAEPRQTAKIIPLFSPKLYKITGALAASIVLILIAYFFIFQPGQSTQQLANQYFEAHLQQLSLTMDASSDSLQLGIAAYNKKDYPSALRFFQGVYLRDPDNSEAQKNIGLVYLATKDYDKAVQQFEELAARQNLYSNPGLFLQAVTLLQRNQAGDELKAKQLLQQVIAEKAEGNREAAEWLKKF